MLCLEVRISLSLWPEIWGHTVGQGTDTWVPQGSPMQDKSLQPDLAPARVIAGTNMGVDGAICHGTWDISPARSPDAPPAIPIWHPTFHISWGL